MYVYVCTSVCHMCEGIHRDQRRVLHPLEPELHADMSWLTWVLGTELWSSGRTVSLFTAEPSVQPTF